MFWSCPMRRALSLALPVSLALLALSSAPAVAGPRPSCNTPSNQGFHFKITASYGKRDADTQRIFDKMAARQAGLDPKMVRRTGDGCLEVFVQNPDGSYENKYFDPDTMRLVFD
jgi:hypothetical protein